MQGHFKEIASKNNYLMKTENCININYIAYLPTP